ncbi:MAG: arylesterase [Proteobacteria bacterium]|nr:arylesterase [Pseudomonadota bacterium]
MLWFVNDHEAESQRIGLDCHRENGAYVVTVVDSDGSESRTTFDNEDSMTAEAVRIHLGLEHRGWRALPRIEQHVTLLRILMAGVFLGGLARLDWLLGEKPDLVIVELGANDGLRGLDPDLTRDNLDRIITRIRETGARVLLAGMVAPPNLGTEYGEKFNALYPALAEKHGTTFYPFFLEGVSMDPALNQQDAIHPNAQGYRKLAEAVADLLRRSGAI